jgi:hypothetical protein
MNIFRIDAVYIIHPEAKSSDDDGFYNGSGDKIILNEDLVSQKETELEAEYNAQAYARNRALEYPSLQECVHAILDDQLDALQAKRAEIKTKYPKGG